MRRDVPGDDGGEIIFARGTMADYRQLARHHYKSHHHPGGALEVWTLRAPRPATAADRFAKREPEPAMLLGVLVVGLPRLACTLRDVATHGRYLGLGDRRAQADLLNREMRTIQRVVIDPRGRGLGLAARLTAHALANASTVYTEALAAMGRVNPFFEKAGMTRYDRPARKEYARMLDAFAELGWRETDIARSEERVLSMIEALDAVSRRWFEMELRRWYAGAFFQPRGGMRSVSTAQCIKAAREHLLTRPVYYLKRNQHVDAACQAAGGGSR